MVRKERVTVRVEEPTLSNTLQLTAIVELLEERGIMTQGGCSQEDEGSEG